jgi:pimeloyl-ACP methyl ester carboxylesterase
MTDTAVRTPTEVHLAVNGIDLALFDWPGAGPPILFAHATGFHARCWDQVIARLPGRHCVAVDLRGHGRGAKPPPPYHWPDTGADVAAAVSLLDLRGIVAVGHSGGGYAVTLAAGLTPDRFARLLLVDPSILSRERYGPPPPERAGAHFALKRRNRWASAEEMIERFADRHPYNLWQPAVLRDYCVYGLLPAADGDGFVLACPPEVEAAVYAGAATHDPYEVIHRLDLPVRVLRARQRDAAAPAGVVDMSFSPTAPDLAAHFPRGEDVLIPDRSHFIPMEDPDLVAKHILDLLA